METGPPDVKGNVEQQEVNLPRDCVEDATCVKTMPHVKQFLGTLNPTQRRFVKYRLVYQAAGRAPDVEYEVTVKLGRSWEVKFTCVKMATDRPTVMVLCHVENKQIEIAKIRTYSKLIFAGVLLGAEFVYYVSGSFERVIAFILLLIH